MAWCVDVEIHVDTSLSDGLTGELRLRASYSTPHRGHLQLHLSDDTTWRTWEATLGPSQLRELAKENHFGEDPPSLFKDYMQLMGESLASFDTVFKTNMVSEGCVGCVLSWSTARACCYRRREHVLTST